MADFNQLVRDQMLKQAILQAAPDTTLGAVAAWLPADFDTDEPELADMLARMAAEQPIEFEGTPEPTPEAPAETPDAAEPVAPSLTSQEARAVVVDWGYKLSAARGALMGAVSRQHAGREKLAAAIGQFVRGFPQRTREDLQREYLASEAERRQRVADGLEAPTGTRQAPSGVLTRNAFYRRGGGVNSAGGNKHLGKARSLIAQQQALGLKPAVGAPKLPSQR